MARSRQGTSILNEELSADEQATLDAMRDAPEPAADEAPVERRETEPAEPKEQQTTVPHAALHEERERRKAIEKEFNEYRRTTDDRFAQIIQRFAPQQQEQPKAPEIPAIAQDPIAHFEARLAHQQRIIDQLSQGSQQQQQISNRQQLAEAVRLTAQAQEKEYRESAPDYDAAAAYLRESRHREFAALGFTNPAEREAMVQQDALHIAAVALQKGESFPAAIYKVAQERGYRNGDAAPQGDATDRLTRQAAGQQQARSLGNARGTAPAPSMTAQRMVEMSEAAFSKMLDEATPAQMREMFGS